MTAQHRPCSVEENRGGKALLSLLEMTIGAAEGFQAIIWMWPYSLLRH